MQEFISRQTDLPSHVIQLSRYFRTHGFEIGPKVEGELLTALSEKMTRSFDEHQDLHKALLVKNRKQYLEFDELYTTYWNELSKAEDSKKQEYGSKNKGVQKEKPSELQVLKNWLYGGHVSEEKDLASYSNLEVLTKKDFSAFSDDEHKELQEILRLISRQLSNKQSRRFERSKKKDVLDLKHTIHKAIKHNNDIRELIYKKRKKKKVKLILICDVSKSMELYSKFIIDFIYSFQQAAHRLHTFVFSTKLVSISRALRDENYEKTLSRLSEEVNNWSGGTNIGESLYQFKKFYGTKLIDKDAIIIIVSDGWDTGEMDKLESTILYMQKKSHRVLWLNPLASNPDYKPSTRAMEIAMPYIDVFSAAHNIESLKAISHHLQLKKYKPKF